jgi:hypothetical protein
LVASVITAVVIAVAPAASATSSGDARSTGDGLVHRLRQSHACDVSTKRGFIAGGDNYLASCTSKDGSFGFIVVVQAKAGGLTAKSSYIEGRVNETCKDSGGAVFTAGVRDRFVAMYLGRGSGADKAASLWQGLADQIGSTAGHFVIGEKCAQGAITQKFGS